MGPPHSKHCLVVAAHKHLFQTLALQQYGMGCLMIAKFIEAVTDIPMRVVGLRCHGRVIPHYVNVTEFGDIIDAKSRVFAGNLFPPMHSHWQGNNFLPVGRKAQDYILKPNMMSFTDPTQARKYLSFLAGTLKTGSFPESWKQYAELLVNSW